MSNNFREEPRLANSPSPQSRELISRLYYGARQIEAEIRASGIKDVKAYLAGLEQEKLTEKLARQKEEAEKLQRTLKQKEELEISPQLEIFQKRNYSETTLELQLAPVVLMQLVYQDDSSVQGFIRYLKDRGLAAIPVKKREAVYKIRSLIIAGISDDEVKGIIPYASFAIELPLDVRVREARGVLFFEKVNQTASGKLSLIQMFVPRSTQQTTIIPNDLVLEFPEGDTRTSELTYAVSRHCPAKVVDLPGKFFVFGDKPKLPGSVDEHIRSNGCQIINTSSFTQGIPYSQWREAYLSIR